jgi:hypothetical protein
MGSVRAIPLLVATLSKNVAGLRYAVGTLFTPCGAHEMTPLGEQVGAFSMPCSAIYDAIVDIGLPALPYLFIIGADDTGSIIVRSLCAQAIYAISLNHGLLKGVEDRGRPHKLDQSSGTPFECVGYQSPKEVAPVLERLSTESLVDEDIRTGAAEALARLDAG